MWPCVQSDHSLALFFRDQHFAFGSWDHCVPCDIVTDNNMNVTCGFTLGHVFSLLILSAYRHSVSSPYRDLDIMQTFARNIKILLLHRISNGFRILVIWTTQTPEASSILRCRFLVLGVLRTELRHQPSLRGSYHLIVLKHKHQRTL